MYKVKVKTEKGLLYLKEMKEVNAKDHYCQDSSWGGGVSIGILVIPEFTAKEKEAKEIGTHIDLLRILRQMIDAFRFKDIDLTYEEIIIIKGGKIKWQ